MSERFFCSVASRASGESIYGTVAHIETWLLIEYPSVWRRHAIGDSLLLSKAFKRHIALLQETGKIDRALLIRREHRLSGPIQCFFVRSSEKRSSIKRALLADYDDLLQMAEGEQPVEPLMFAVCTHGRHDKCCAKFGLPVYGALNDLVGDRVWECSHVGGDRFAGNVVVFPYGIFYGRVTPDDTAEIVKFSERGEIWLKGYRGRSCYRRIVQAAEYFARSQSGRLAIDEFELIDSLSLDSTNSRVRFRSRSDSTVHLVEFATTRDRLSEMLTCHSTEPSPVAQHELLRYSVTGG
jgi:hypothetical protein